MKNFKDFKLQEKFFGYITNTAAAVRIMGIEKVKVLASKFGSDWIVKDFIPMV